MDNTNKKISTGLTGLDNVIDSLRPGDNVVWNTPSFGEYTLFARPFVKHTVKSGKKVGYIHFADHPPLIKEEDNVTIYNISSSTGFCTFTEDVYHLIKENKNNTYYVFDSLSFFLESWASDEIVSYFFRSICPLVSKLGSVAYLSLYQQHHKPETLKTIREATQVTIEVYNDRTIYVHPQHAVGRISPTMFIPHSFESDNKFIPITNSFDVARLLRTYKPASGDYQYIKTGAWKREFEKAKQLIKTNKETEKKALKEKLVSMITSRDQRIIYLINRHFSLEDILKIHKRTIGTGFIGGKSSGFLLARKILQNDPKESFERYLEPNDSFYIASDVFHAFIIHNGWWDLFMEQRTPEGYFKAGKKLEKLFPEGKLPPEIKTELKKMMDYFGQAPIIVRSSSILEDGYGNAFAGKYESYFCSIMGTPEERYRDLFKSIKLVYASSMSRDALEYRRRRGMKATDERMCILVQRVSGSYQDHFFYPHAAGVGLSYNTYVWNRNIDPEAGMLRIVMGLGTRAVNRVEGDYPRIVSLSDPELIPLADTYNKMRYSQRDLDVLDVINGGKHCISLMQITKGELNFDLNELARRDFETERRLAERGRQKQSIWVLTFQKLLSGEFPNIMKNLMTRLEQEYQNPVEIEFTLNFIKNSEYVINLLQCRPVQKSISTGRYKKLGDIQHNKILLETNGHFMGGNIHIPVDWLVFVDAEKYSLLSLNDKHNTAKAVSMINKSLRALNKHAVLFGPGRWGTSTPSLGVPIVFADINGFSAICEVEYDAGGLYPELSFGSHFFQDLVENGTFYMALFTERKESIINYEEIWKLREISGIILEADPKVAEAIKIYDTGGKAFLNSDIEIQKAVIIL